MFQALKGPSSVSTTATFDQKGQLNELPDVKLRTSNKIKYTGHFIMYSGITKIYYRKTVGHVFTTSVQIEGTTQKFFSQ